MGVADLLADHLGSDKSCNPRPFLTVTKYSGEKMHVLARDRDATAAICPSASMARCCR
jgi:hypothetical protein